MLKDLALKPNVPFTTGLEAYFNKICMNIETPTHYSHIWHKYRPAILRLMLNAEESPQQYAFSAHEFRRMFPKNQNSLTFILYIHRLKALNNIKTSPLAQSLLGVLNQSKTAIRLSESSTYEVMLDRNFVLHVRKNGAAANEVAATSAISSGVATPE